MREIDFLPSWYPVVQRRYRRLIVQVWATLAVLLLLAAYALGQRWQVQTTAPGTARIEAQMRLSQQTHAQLNEKLKCEKELRRQEHIIARLGITLDTTRLLKALEDAMTPDMALTDLSMEADEQVAPPHPATTTGRDSAADAPQPLDKVLRVKVDGVAPDDSEVATLLTNLQKTGCFENVAPCYMRQGSSRAGHVVREFEITFDINLNMPPEDVR